MQIIWDDTLRALALDQWMREIPIVAERGKITDANGVLLAGNQTSYAVFVRARAVKDKEYTCAVLSEILGCDYETIYKKMTSINASEITIARHLGKESIEKLCAYNLDGVYYSRDNTRIYPYGDLLSQVLGFTSSDNSGSAGLEKQYEKYLSGSNGELLYETDLVGVELEGAVAAYLPAENGLNVELTVDYGIQAIAEKVMRRVYEESGAKNAQCIILDPNDFEILAMVNYPSYDLNDVPRNQPDILNSLSRNRLVCDIYEPGSTFKIITAAATIEEYYQGNPNAFSPTSYVFPSSGTRTVDGTTIKCWSSHANGKHSNQTLAEALNNSCNPCFVDMALSLGKETFYKYLDLFSFGGETGIDYSGEALGMLLPESAVRDCDLARIGFGQTIAVTPLQLACAVGAAVNGGYYYTPRLVKRIYSDDGSTNEKIEATLKNRTVSEKASRTLAAMLEGVVSEGSGKKAYVEGYKVGGKTGTAQKYENGHIAAGKYVASFVGFFPSDKPQYLALVVVDEPQGTYYGSAVAAPCAGEIFRGIIELKGIKPYETVQK
ncbi:MAG: stage V sporulation protein D [Clostridia bacterium]|nr:stage V sporulation protein D [Clostridia bacterium]